MNGLVVDASVALKWLVDEPGSETALALRSEDLVAPALLRLEVANALRTLTARGVADADTARGLFSFFLSSPVTIVDGDDALETAALALALDLQHPVYDCVYLALSERMDRDLVTADRRFAAAVRSRRSGSRLVVLGEDA